MLTRSKFQRNSSRIILVLILLVFALASIFIRAVAETPIRMIFGMILVLFLPGYSLVQLLFQLKIHLSIIEHIVTTIFLSIAIVTFIGIILNQTPFGIKLVPVLICISAFVLSISVTSHLLKFRKPDLFEKANNHITIHDRDKDNEIASFFEKNYDKIGLSLACVIIYILNTLPYFNEKILLDMDEWMHIGQVDYVLNHGHTATYNLDKGIMVQRFQYPPAFHSFMAILIQLTNLTDVFVFKWVYLVIFGSLLVLATYLMILQFDGKKKALITSLFLATWMSEGGVHGPLWRIPSTFSIVFFMICLFSFTRYYDTKESIFLLTGGMALGLVLLSHVGSGPTLYICLLCFLLLKIVINRTISKEDVYIFGVLCVIAVIGGIFYWFSALRDPALKALDVGQFWGLSWVYTNWFDISYLFLRPPLLLAPFGLLSLLRKHKKVESLLLTSCYFVGLFFSFSYFIGIYLLNRRFALFWTLISYALSGLGLYEVTQFILNLRSNIRIFLTILLTTGYALFRLINPFSNRPLYITHKFAYDFYANFILGALILTIIIFMTYRTFKNPERLVVFFTILIVIGSSISTATYTYYYEPMMSDQEYLAMLWLKESHEPETIVVYETRELAWLGSAAEVDAPISRFYGETNTTLRAIDRNNTLTSPDVNLTIQLLQKYHINYIFTYKGSSVSQKYELLTVQLPDYFRIAYQNEELVIYEFLS